MRIPPYLQWIFDQPEKAYNEGEIIKEPAGAAKQRLRDLIILIAFGVIAFFFGTGKIALLGPDEPRYAEVAREMFISGDYISTRLAGCLWFEKPALYYWMAASAYRTFGVNEFAARMPSGLMALLTVITIYLTLAKTVSVKWARVASFVLLTSGIFLVYSRAATPDMTLTAAMCGAILSGFMASRNEMRREGVYILLGATCMGLAFLAKGLVGIFLVLAIIFIYLLIVGRLRFVPLSIFALGLIPFLLVSAFWYVPVIAKHGWQFIDEFFIRHHFQRYLTNVYGHPQPIYFFTVVAILGVLPWTFFLLPAVARIRNLQPRRRERDALLALAWIWLLVPLLFFSISESKLPGYLLPVFPALSIIIGGEIESFWEGKKDRLNRTAIWLTSTTLIMIGGMFIGYLIKHSPGFSVWRLVAGSIPVLLGLLAVVALKRGRTQQWLNFALMSMMSLVVCAISLLFPNLNEDLSLKRLTIEAASALRPNEKIGYYILKEFGAVFYAEGRVVCGMGEGDILNALREDKLVEPLKTYPSLIFITRDRWVEGLKKDGRFDVEFIGQQRDFYAFRVKLRELQP
jgi:4-amino-4-deoxy-L-arabinose transferase-like glycosyltransferase